VRDVQPSSRTVHLSVLEALDFLRFFSVFRGFSQVFKVSPKKLPHILTQKKGGASDRAEITV